MNRLSGKTFVGAASGLKSHLFAETLKKWKTPREESQPISIVTPIHYERNYAYPLVVWLHGAGDDERQVGRVLPLMSDRNYVSVGPRGPLRDRSVASAYTWDVTERRIQNARKSVDQAISFACESRNVNRSRIFLAGLGAGGTVALRLALETPERYAGVVSIHGRFPLERPVLRDWHAAKRLSILLCRGDQSVDMSVAEETEELKFFHAAALRVQIRRYLGVTNELFTDMFDDVDRFLMEIVTGMQASAE